jgi:hypothetical protein
MPTKNKVLLMRHEKDADVVKAWIERAIHAITTRGTQLTDIAAHCGVSPQAITGWRKTGRITKKNMAVLADLAKIEPPFTVRYLSGHEDAAGYMAHEAPASWPFRDIDPPSYWGMDDAHRDRVEAYALATLQSFAAHRP